MTERTFGAPIEKPPRTTWKGTPLHELWLMDRDGNLIEIYARLADAEFSTKPEDEAPVFLVPGTEARADGGPGCSIRMFVHDASTHMAVRHRLRRRGHPRHRSERTAGCF